MKVFLVKAESYTYDDYDSVALVAESKERALEIAKEATWKTYETYSGATPYTINTPINIKFDIKRDYRLR